MSSDTVALVEQAQSGDDSAFEELYRSRVQAVFRYAKSIVRNPTVAEDVTAQTFLQAWKALARLRQPERFDSWLFRIAHNVAISEVKRSPQAANLDETPEPVETSRLNDPESLVDLKFDVAAVREGLLGLPEHLREILILRFFSGLSHEEVGRQVGKTAQNVRVMQFRALKRLRAELEESGYTALP